MSTKCAALPARSMSLFLNSVVAALEKVSVSGCSCFTSSKSDSEANLRAGARVLPLPGPAAGAMW